VRQALVSLVFRHRLGCAPGRRLHAFDYLLYHFDRRFTSHVTSALTDEPAYTSALELNRFNFGHRSQQF
jgi:hypothetical protein